MLGRASCINVACICSATILFPAILLSLDACLPLITLLFEGFCLCISPRSVESTVFLKKLEESSLFARGVLLCLTLAVRYEYLVQIRRDLQHFSLLEGGATVDGLVSHATSHSVNTRRRIFLVEGSLKGMLFLIFYGVEIVRLLIFGYRLRIWLTLHDGPAHPHLLALLDFYLLGCKRPFRVRCIYACCCVIRHSCFGTTGLGVDILDICCLSSRTGFMVLIIITIGIIIDT